MHQRSTYNDGSLTNPPAIVGMEVSARWKRTWKGEVIMTIVMPNDVVDTDVYVKTPRGHTGIQMDPWMSCTWRRTWSSTHPNNSETKEKMRKYKLQKAGRRISLFRTAGRSKQIKNRYCSPRPEARHQSHSYAKRRTPSPPKKQQPVQDYQPSHTTQTLLHKKRQREEYSDGSSTDSTPTDIYYEKLDIADGFHSITLSPESPPEYERELKCVDYIPKSPVYPHLMFIEMFQMKTPFMT